MVINFALFQQDSSNRVSDYYRYSFVNTHVNKLNFSTYKKVNQLRGFILTK